MKKSTKIALIICGIFSLSFITIGITYEITKPKTSSKNESTAPENNEIKFSKQNIINNSVLIKKTSVFSSKEGKNITKVDYYTSRLFLNKNKKICIEEWFLYQKNYLVENNEIFFLSKTVYEYQYVNDANNIDVNNITWKNFNEFSYEINNNFNENFVINSNITYPFESLFIDVLAKDDSTIYNEYNDSSNIKNIFYKSSTDYIDIYNENFFIEYKIDKNDVFKYKFVDFDYEKDINYNEITYSKENFYLLENTFYSINFLTLSLKNSLNNNFLFGSLLYIKNPIPYIYIGSEYNMFVVFIHELIHRGY